MKRVLTGIQPSGNITLGNYFGAITQMTKYQHEYDSFMFIADLHSITVPQEPDKLRGNIQQLVALYLACGVTPEKTTMFLQSDNFYHANLGWIFECLTPYGELSRQTQFKDKSAKNLSFSGGLLTYPALMAADILLYDADFVPVGADQKQHVELCRDTAERFNKKYGRTFLVPQPLIRTDTARVMDLQSPGQKMSKSSDNPKGIVYLLDPLAATVKKFKSAVTDSDGEIIYAPDRAEKAGISNLISIFAGFAGEEPESVAEKYAGSSYGKFKTDLADIAVSVIEPIQKRYDEILHSGQIEAVFDAGREKTTAIAAEKYGQVRRLVGVCR